MTTYEYNELVKNGLVSSFRGNLNRSSFDFKDRQHFEEVYKKVEPIMLKQLTDDFDINYQKSIEKCISYQNMIKKP
jgi:hypothetical protein